MSGLLRALLLLATLQLAACAGVSPKLSQQAAAVAQAARSTEVSCATPCAPPSPLLDLGTAAMAASTPAAPHHSVVMLDSGLDSLMARVHLIASARHSIDLQTFHFEQDDSGRLVLDALMDAARRGVHVRLLMDQLSGLDNARIQAHLAGFHQNFELRMYNPVFSQGSLNYLEFVAGVVFKFRDVNSRMHNKLMVVDGTVGIVGGRNIQDEYFDWHPAYDYRDRDLLVAGPAATTMVESFDAFWNDPRSLAPTELVDVANLLVREGRPASAPMPARTPRVEAMARVANDGAAVYARLAPYRTDVGRVDFMADLPSKHDAAAQRHNQLSLDLLALVAGTQKELLLQTPYLVISRPARKLFRDLRKRESPPKVRVSTNSLAATDAFPVYAMSHKYKRLYLRELGFDIYEYKPFPEDAPIDPEATGAMGADVATAATARAAATGLPWPVPDGGAIAVPPTEAGLPAPLPATAPDDLVTASTAPEPGKGLRRFRRLGPVPLKRAGLRIGLHAKSLVIDRRIAVVGSHNFDPRSDDYNTESLVVVHDAVFAQRLADSIERDMAPPNAWVIAPREQLPILWGLNYNLGKLSEKLPVFDIWPLPYATSYELRPGCAPRPPTAPDFHECYQAVGDFPEVNLGLKGIYTRVLTVFGAGLIPIL